MPRPKRSVTKSKNADINEAKKEIERLKKLLAKSGAKSEESEDVEEDEDLDTEDGGNIRNMIHMWL